MAPFREPLPVTITQAGQDANGHHPDARASLLLFHGEPFVEGSRTNRSRITGDAVDGGPFGGGGHVRHAAHVAREA